MVDFTPWSALAGGALIGLSASLVLFLLGRVAGISGILSGLLLQTRGETPWRAWFVVGLLTAGAIGAVLMPQSIGVSPRGLIGLSIAGLLVGIGTRIGSGCTSGHGVCGIARFSGRSLLATLVFIGTGSAMVLAVRVLGGGS